MPRVFHGALGLALLFVWPGPTQATLELETAAGILEAGAVHLALTQLQAIEPADGTSAWERWARLKVHALQRLGRGQAVVAWAEQPLPEASAQFRYWLQLQAAAQELKLKRPVASRHRVVRLLTTDPQPEPIRPLLRLIYRSYHQQGRLEDAATVVQSLRTRAEVEPPPPEVRHEQATILMAVGTLQTAREVLGEPKHPKGHRIKLRILMAQGHPHQALQQAQAWADTAASDTARRLAYLTIAEAADQLGQERTRARALERVVVQPDASSAAVGRLWEAYLAHGEQLGTQAQLRLGEDDTQWLAQAETQTDLDQRALYGVVALAGHARSARRRAQVRLLDALHQANRDWVGVRLFQDGPAFTGETEFATAVQVRLARMALEADHLALSLHWMEGINDLPEEVAPFAWRLTRARLHIRLGHLESGIADLHRLAAHPQWLRERKRRSPFLQVVFELQEADRHKSALTLFRTVYEAVQEHQVRREMLFWMAECQEALDAQQAAAVLYLRSADQRTDHWGHTARFRAARALEQLPAYQDDAQTLYRRLLETVGGDRRQVIRRRLRQLQAEARDG